MKFKVSKYHKKSLDLVYIGAVLDLGTWQSERKKWQKMTKMTHFQPPSHLIKKIFGHIWNLSSVWKFLTLYKHVKFSIGHLITFFSILTQMKNMLFFHSPFKAKVEFPSSASDHHTQCSNIFDFYKTSHSQLRIVSWIK